MISKRVKAVASAVTVAGAVTVAILAPASTAVAYSSGGVVLDVQVQSPATLIARGAAVSVPVAYTCSGTSPYTRLYVSVSQRVSGGGVATGEKTVTGLTCNGEIQAVAVEVAASGVNAFKRGDAYVHANINDCYMSCADENDSRTVAFQR